MLSRPILETALWLVLLLLALIPLSWVIRPFALNEHEQLSHKKLDASHTLLTQEVAGLLSWRATMPIEQLNLVALTSQGELPVFNLKPLEMSGEDWLDLHLPEGSTTYLLKIDWLEPKAEQAFELKLNLGQAEEKSWFFWSDDESSIEQIIEF